MGCPASPTARTSHRIMSISSARTLICSVLFLDIEDYSPRPVVEQLATKKRFNKVLSEALRNVPADDRIVLDTGDGAAVSFLSEPENALFAAMIFRDEINELAAEPEAPALQVRMGINLGPVRLLKDINGQINIIGDGINNAQRVMSFAEAGKILASRSYFEVVSRISDDFAKLFAYDSTRTDKHIREHTLYAIATSIPGPLPLHPETSDKRAEAVPFDPLRRQAAPPAKERKPLRLAAIGAAVLLGGAATAMFGRTAPLPPAPTAAAAPAAEPARAPHPVTAAAPPAKTPTAPAKSPATVAAKGALPAGKAIPKEASHPAAVRSEAQPPRPPAQARKDKAEDTAPAWVEAMRSELAACGNFICKEAVRWKYCPKVNWDTYDECQVNKN